MCGWMHLPRYIDKVRLHLAGKLSADYQGNFAHKGFDAKWLTAASLPADDFIAVVQGTTTDGEVCDWVAANVQRSAADKAAFNQWLLAHGTEPGPDGDALRDRLKLRKEQSGLAHRDDLRTFVDYIDADEKRS